MKLNVVSRSFAKYILNVPIFCPLLLAERLDRSDAPTLIGRVGQDFSPRLQLPSSPDAYAPGPVLRHFRPIS